MTIQNLKENENENETENDNLENNESNTKKSMESLCKEDEKIEEEDSQNQN